jgi:hypothetical protein
MERSGCAAKLKNRHSPQNQMRCGEFGLVYFLKPSRRLRLVRSERSAKPGQNVQISDGVYVGDAFQAMTNSLSRDL